MIWQRINRNKSSHKNSQAFNSSLENTTKEDLRGLKCEQKNKIRATCLLSCLGSTLAAKHKASLMSYGISAKCKCWWSQTPVCFPGASSVNNNDNKGSSLCLVGWFVEGIRERTYRKGYCQGQYIFVKIWNGWIWFGLYSRWHYFVGKDKLFDSFLRFYILFKVNEREIQPKGVILYDVSPQSSGLNGETSHSTHDKWVFLV